ncbi:MAG: dynamin family protein, partial [Gammaproteobacteria bacterium]|nr:dynamin family protein [Gammaproteobacteria bacterium]
MFGRSSPLQQRIKKLRAHLAQENPLLLDVVKSFRTLDDVAYRLGLLEDTQSFATRVPWWPMIAVLGTFSSGKSTFINFYLGEKLQQTGNQAVDDKFTVICYSNDDTARVLPGLALDADPRFPFYQMSRDIEAVAAGEGKRVDAYLQLKTCHSEGLKGKIIIDSPGFDADEQRTATLRITDHIIDLSDLVLVFFDARHPEPGAMHDTLEHLVADTIHRADSNKFLYVLNQIDNAAREDNPEEVFAAWQRALAQKGLTAGRFYSIYNLDVAIPIENEKLRERFESRRATDMQAIMERIEQVEVERAYRITGVMEQTARAIEESAVPALREARRRWKRRTLWADGIVFGALVALVLGASVQAGYWQGLAFAPPWLPWLVERPLVLWLIVAALVLGAGYVHFVIRRAAAGTVRAAMRRLDLDQQLHEWLERAFDKNTRAWQPLWGAEPVGWTAATRKRIAQVLSEADRYVQDLNSRFTDPSGRTGAGRARRAAESAAAAPKPPEAP